jgi:hypothetical protein
MFEWRKWWPQKRGAQADSPYAKASGDRPAYPDMSGDVVTDFPRGLPDGDSRKPVGTARWIASTDACGLLDEWKPGRFLIGRDSAGRYVGHDDDRHILTVAGSRAGELGSLAFGTNVSLTADSWLRGAECAIIAGNRGF